jgi:hypothetical protein
MCDFRRRLLLRSFLFLATATGLSVATSGCRKASDVGKTVPVAGKITLGDEPLTAPSTVILFKPDVSQGNTSPFEPTGTVDRQGNYTLSTKGKKGAPPGWYRVVVSAIAEPSEHPRTPGKQGSRPVAQSLVPARYGQAATTDLVIEVVENPAAGAYDLNLRK